MRKINPDMIFVILLILMFVFHFFLSARIVKYPYTLSGILVLIIGIWIMLWSHSYFKETTIKPNEIPKKFILKGPYKFSRNPMYFGFVLMLIGVFLLLGSISSLVGPVALFILLDSYFIPMEENNMKNAFGKEFTEYKKKTHRWI